MQLDRTILYGGLAAAVTAATLLAPDSIERLPPACTFRQVTGLPCPGCGLTRSWALTAHGRLGEALRRHPFGPLTFVGALAVVLRGPGAVPMRTLPVAQRHALTSLGVTWLVWALLRMARDSR